MEDESKIIEPPPKVYDAFQGFLSHRQGFETVSREYQLPTALGGSEAEHYILKNGVQVDQHLSPVMQGTMFQYDVRLPTGESFCFYIENQRPLEEDLG